MNLSQMLLYFREEKSKIQLFVKLGLFCCFLSVFALPSHSQNKLQIENGDLIINQVNQPDQSVLLKTNEKGQAKLIQKETSMESNSIIFFEQRNYAEANENVYINQNDSIDIYSNQAKYFGNKRRVELIGEVALLQDVFTLQTNKLNYDLDKKIATYTTGGELNDTTSTLTSKIGTYYVDKNEVLFTDSVVLVSPDRTIETQQLKYNLNDKWAYFEGPTTIYEQDQIIKTNKGKYNVDTGAAVLEGEPKIDNETQLATADQFLLDEESGFGVAKGNVYIKDKENDIELKSSELKQINDDEFELLDQIDVISWQDSIQLTSDFARINSKTEQYFATGNATIKLLNQDGELLADTLSYSDQSGIGTATGRPILSTANEGDSIFVVAKKMTALRKIYGVDTLYDGSLEEQILLYKSDLQAAADSAYYSQKDSILTLFKNPVLWTDSLQMTADTITLHFKNQELNKVEFRQNCFFIQWVEQQLFNQLKGREMDAYFKENNLDSLHVNGNAQTIFMVQDDDKSFIAVDEMEAGKMDVLLEDNKLSEIFWFNQLKGTTYPFEQSNPETKLLQGFKWREQQRPKSKDDLLVAQGRKEGDYQFKQNTESKESILSNENSKEPPTIDILELEKPKKENTDNPISPDKQKEE